MSASRRGILLTLAGVGLFLIAGGWITVSGMGADGSPSRYVEGVLGHPQRINPLAPRASDAEADLVALIFSGLTRISANGTPVPDLARSWEVTPDGLTYT